MKDRLHKLPAALHAAWSGNADADVVAFVRPHDLDFVPAASAEARVESVRDLGSTVRIETRHPALPQPLVSIHERGRFHGSGLGAGQTVAIEARRWVLFRGDEAVARV